MFLKDKFQKAHMRTAEVYAELSSARRLHVGCVIVKNDTIIGIGYNGMPSGWDNNCEIELHQPVGRVDLVTKPEVIHAEANALAKVTKSTNSSENALLFVTHAPCLDCAKQIYQAGIKAVYYRNTYKSEVGLEFLQQCGVETIQVN